MPLKVKAALKVKVQEDGGLEEDSLEERKGEKVAGMHRQRRDEAHLQRVGGLLNSRLLLLSVASDQHLCGHVPINMAACDVSHFPPH